MDNKTRVELALKLVGEHLEAGRTGVTDAAVVLAEEVRRMQRWMHHDANAAIARVKEVEWSVWYDVRDQLAEGFPHKDLPDIKTIDDINAAIVAIEYVLKRLNAAIEGE